MRIFLALALLLAACGTSTQATSTTTSEPASTTTTVVVATTTTEPGPITTTTSTTGAPPPPEPVLLDNPVIELTLPEGIISAWEHPVAVGDNGWVVVAGDWSEKGVARDPGFWHTRNGVDWDEFRLSEVVSTEFVEITDLVYFDGRYIASLMGDAATVDPTIVVSEDGVRWDAESLQVGGSVGLPGVFGTPESPPWPGASAISDMAVRGDELVAVGWVLQDGGSSPAVWRTTDGEIWSRSLLPNQYSDREWAQQVAVGEAGYLVTGLGPFHSPDYLWSSTDGQTWKPIQLSKDYFFGHGGIAVGDLFWATLMFDGGRPEELYRSDDGLEWESVEFPAAIEPIGVGSRDMVGFGPNWLMLVTDPDASGWMLEDDGTRYTLPLADFPRFGWVLNRQVAVARSAEGIDLIPVMSDRSSSVIDVASDDVLNVRAGPGVDNEIVATLPHDSTGVRRFGVDVNGWYLIVGPTGQVGWVNGAFLTPEG